jgi:hypothetical protein
MFPNVANRFQEHINNSIIYIFIYFLLGRNFKFVAHNIMDSHRSLILIDDLETTFNKEFVGMYKISQVYLK